MKHIRSSQKAFSLLETMLALALGLLLIALILHVYLGIKSVYQTTQENARLQENLRFAAYFLREKISMAGYAGCGKLDNLVLDDGEKNLFAPKDIVRGYSSKTLPASDEMFYFVRYNISDNTDVIVIKKADENPTELTVKETKKGTTSIPVNINPAANANDLVFISDCVNADLFKSGTYQVNRVESYRKIDHIYHIENTQISRFTDIAYFISSTASQTEKTRYGLYYAINGGEKEMMVDGVTNMQIRYGVKLNKSAGALEYKSADDITKQNWWDRVLSVIITLTQETKDGKEKKFDVYIKLRERGL